MTNKNAIVRQTFGGTEIQSHKETAALAVAAQAKAGIEARWIIAKGQPRDLDAVYQDLSHECKRPPFAAVAIYNKPIGKGIEGLSIRFVEQALQCMGNVDTESVTVYDDADKRIVKVSVTDFQRNVSHSKQITITKLVERLYLKKGQVPISQRVNSQGKTTYSVHASEDDLLNKEGALVSKAIRTCGLRIIPGWLQDECEQIIRKTAATETARDPDAEKRKLLDAFGGLSVTPASLEEYLGHPLAQVVPAELVQLRATYTAISSGEATWVDTLAHRNSLRSERKEEPQEPAEAKPVQRGTQAVKDGLRAREKPQAPPAPSAATSAAEMVDAGILVPAPSAADLAEAKAVHEASLLADKHAERARAKADIEERHASEEHEDARAAHAEKTERTMAATQAQSENPLEAKGVAPGAKRPSASKAHQAMRKEELKELGHAPGKFATLYIKYGDPRNLAKSKAAMGERLKAEAAKSAEDLTDEHPDPPTDDDIKDAFPETATTPGGTQHDAQTGEVIDMGKEPAWMDDDSPPIPPPGEGF